MYYEMEELLPVVAKLSEKYTGFENTSLTYEKAEQLMCAVLYCIHEIDIDKQNDILTTAKISAQQAYDIGYKYVVEKVKRALNMYNSISPKFISYQNQCLHDTFIKGLPEFFKWYDSKFEPQNTILTLDYPVLKNISVYNGIDRIYEFINCIRLEQIFLGKFSRNYITNILYKYSSQYKDIIENICEIVFMSIIGHIYVKKPLSEQSFTEDDYTKLQMVFLQTEKEDIKKQLTSMTKSFIQEYYENNSELLHYLNKCIEDIIVRFKNAAVNGVIQQLI